MSTLPPPVDAKTAYDLLAAGSAPADLRVEGVLDYSQSSARTLPRTWPDQLHVDVLDLSGRPIDSVPEGLRAYELNLAGTLIRALPENLRVESCLNLSRCERLESLPTGLSVGSLVLRACTSLISLPESLDVWFLDLTGCWAFEYWPLFASIQSGRLRLRGCTALRTLPPYLRRVSALDVCDCPNLRQLPDDLVVTGWIDLGRSGLTAEDSLPSGLAQTQLRWAGVGIDRRIAFRPETITVAEVLAEKNAERRRVLLERYGYGRFLKDAGAEIVDSDRDPGGPRQLLCVKMAGDEDLVAMSCLCPSTGRQYIIRVPPTTPTCRHAAAWIAGFDDPNDYQPLIET